jgi:hypothetical protein
VRTHSGETLSVSFQSHDGRFHDVFQEGEARFIYSGALSPEAWR